MTKKKILVIDDDAGILDAVSLILEDAGYQVVVSRVGLSAQEVHKIDPALILLDIWMTGWNGRDVCMALKNDKNTKHIPIIILSANKDTALIANEAGADDFLAKPFEMEMLLSKARKYA